MKKHWRIIAIVSAFAVCATGIAVAKGRHHQKSGAWIKQYSAIFCDAHHCWN
jgi:hypothetical protein